MNKKDWILKIIEWLDIHVRGIFWIRKLWYLVLLVLSTWYVLSNFEDIVCSYMLYLFNGNSLIFIVWIILLILPLFDYFEGFGVKFNNKVDTAERINNLADNIKEKESNLSVLDLTKRFHGIKKDSDD